MDGKKQIVVEYDKYGNLDLTSLVKHGVFIPNWFDKKHFEEFMGINLTESKFEALSENLQNCGIADAVSRIVREWLDTDNEDIKEILE